MSLRWTTGSPARPRFGGTTVCSRSTPRCLDGPTSVLGPAALVKASYTPCACPVGLDGVPPNLPVSAASNPAFANVRSLVYRSLLNPAFHVPPCSTPALTAALDNADCGGSAVACSSSPSFALHQNLCPSLHAVLWHSFPQYLAFRHLRHLANSRGRLSHRPHSTRYKKGRVSVRPESDRTKSKEESE